MYMSFMKIVVNILQVKSDVYSFGIVLQEILRDDE